MDVKFNNLVFMVTRCLQREFWFEPTFSYSRLKASKALWRPVSGP